MSERNSDQDGIVLRPRQRNSAAKLAALTLAAGAAVSCSGSTPHHSTPTTAPAIRKIPVPPEGPTPTTPEQARTLVTGHPIPFGLMVRPSKNVPEVNTYPT